MTAPTIEQLSETLAALRGREMQIPLDLDAANAERGALALAAATSGDTAALDAHDAKVAALEREAQTVAAAIQEAGFAIAEAKARSKITTARAAVKRLPTIERKVKTAYAELAKAIESVSAALAKAKAAEAEGNALAEDAVPHQLEDIYGRTRFEFSATANVARLIEQALTDPDAVRETVAERLEDHIATKVAAIAAESDLRQQAIEQAMKDKRAGSKGDAAAAHFASSNWQMPRCAA